MREVVQLIRPPFDKSYDNRGQFSDLEAPPIGLAILAKALSIASPGTSVRVLDGLGLSLSEIITQLQGDIVCVSDIYSSHSTALKILEEAKLKGAITFIGGPNVTHLAENILRNHAFVDYAIIGDGEVPLPRFVTGEKVETIPNLVYRKNGRVIKNDVINAPLNVLFDLRDISPLHFNIKNAMPLSSIRGCVKAEEKGRCTFCSMKHGLIVMEPELVWKQIRLLYEEYGITYFWETGDSFIVKDFPSKLLYSRPADLSHIQLKMYTSPDQLNEENIKTLNALNARGLYIGIESVDDRVLKRAGKGYTKADIESALLLAERYGISIHVPFILGLPGTTLETLEKDFRFAQQLVLRFPGMKMIVSLPILFPGTELFENIRANPKARSEYSGDLTRDDSFDWRRLFEIHTRHYTSVKPDTVYEYYERMRELIRREGDITSFGINTPCRNPI